MKIAYTHNVRLTDSVSEAEFDAPETVHAISEALASLGHSVERIDVRCPASHLVNCIEAAKPDLVFNAAEGSRGRLRQAFYPALFDQLMIPYTGSDAYALTLTLDKQMSKKVAGDLGFEVPRGFVVNERAWQEGRLDLGRVRFPVIVKPNYEGSSKGIDQKSIVSDLKSLHRVISERLSLYPLGLLVEEFIDGRDIVVPCLVALEEGESPALEPVEVRYPSNESSSSREYAIYDYDLKHTSQDQVELLCPAPLPSDLSARLRAKASELFWALGCSDLASIDFRLGRDGRLYFLEANALPSLTAKGIFMASAQQAGLSMAALVERIVDSACVRSGLRDRKPLVRAKPVRTKAKVGLAFNMKRSKDDHEAEFDPPQTIDALEASIRRAGFDVVRLEANSDFPKKLLEEHPDVVFNIAEGHRGRAREALVPAICELYAVPYTGSDATTLAIALDKSLAKKIMLQNGILTPLFQTFVTGREKLKHEFRYPCILKPNAEGSSKGIEASKAIAHSEEDLREKVLYLVEKYGQPVLVEEYIFGREFTVGLLGETRPRVLPPMEIVFLDHRNETPVYDYGIKQDYKDKVRYDCPSRVTPEELRKLERAAREVFEALGCRDVARVDMKMSPEGEVFVIEVNPLPGLTPSYSDLVLIAESSQMDYDTLVKEILAGGLKRMRNEKRSKSAGRAKEGDVLADESKATL